MALSNFTRTTLASYISGVSFPAPPTTLYLTLSTSDPTPDATGLTEPAGIIRQAITLSTPNVVEATGTASSNTNPIQFTGMSGTITHVAFMDALVGGNMLFSAPLEVQRVVTAGDSVSFAVGTVQIAMDGAIGGSLASDLLRWASNTGPSAASPTVALALSTTQIKRDGTAFTRPGVSVGYVDKTVAVTIGAVDLALGIPVSNTNDVVFGPASTGSWGSVISAALVRGDTGGLLLYGPTSDANVTPIGEGISFVAGSFSVRIK